MMWMIQCLARKAFFVLDRARDNFLRYFTNNGVSVAASPLDNYVDDSSS